LYSLTHSPGTFQFQPSLSSGAYLLEAYSSGTSLFLLILVLWCLSICDLTHQAPLHF
jgi:hypothetical protein